MVILSTIMLDFRMADEDISQLESAHDRLRPVQSLRQFVKCGGRSENKNGSYFVNCSVLQDRVGARNWTMEGCDYTSSFSGPLRKRLWASAILGFLW